MRQIRIWCLGLSLLCGPVLYAAFPPDTLSQYFEYQAQDLGEVYLAWKPYDASAEQLLRSNPGTRLLDDLMYTPMAASAEAYAATVRLPEGQKFYYCFWVTRGSDGDYRDYWDVRSGATIVAAGDSLVVSGLPESSVAQSEPTPGAYGPWLLAGLILLYALARGLPGRSLRPRDVSYSNRLVATGLAAGWLHLAARAEILYVSLGDAYRRPIHTVGRILGAGLEDLVVLGTVTAVGYGIVLAAGRRGKAWMSFAFTLVFLLLTLLAHVNVDTVRYLGNPFTYQWLYYSDFLMGADAWAAAGEKASAARLVNIVSLTLAVIVLARILELLLRRLPPGWAALFLPLLFAAVLAGSLLARQTVNLQAKPGQRANAVAAFLRSLVNTDAPDAFGRMEVAAQSFPFRERTAPARDTVITTEAPPIENVVVIVLESAAGHYFDGPDAYPQITEPLRRYTDDYLYFDRVYAHAPSTNCTMVSLLTGLYPKLSYESVTKEFTDYPFTSLPSVLRSAGYRTSFFTSGDLDWQNAKQFLQHRDFDTVEDFREIPCAREYRLQSGNYQESGGIDDNCLADRLSDWVGQGSGQPFFSMIWTVQSHYPYYFDGKKTDFGVEGFYEDRYLNALRHGTEAVVTVLEDLRHRGLDSTTLVVVTGDHGEAFGQHGHHGHGNTLYEEDLRVPLYLIHPGTFSGGIHSELGGVKDLPSTILSLLKLPVPESWQGRDLLHSNSEEGFYFSPWTQLFFGYRRGNMKYIFNESNRTVQVFDLAADPDEEHDLSGEVSEQDLRAARLRVAAWVQHQNALYDSLP